jgi:hypothetical protein
MSNNATTATQVTDKFRKDVEKVSKDKVKGEIVQHFRQLFAPVIGIRISGGFADGAKTTPVGRLRMTGQPSKKLRAKAAKKKKKA